MTGAEAAKLVVTIVGELAKHVPTLIDELQRNPDWRKLVGDVGKATARPTETEVAAEKARQRLGDD